MGVLLSVLWKKKTPGTGRPAQRRPGKRIRFPKLEPCFAELHSSLSLWQPDEQKVQKLVKMGFAEVDVRSALQDCGGYEILAIEKLRLGQQVQKLVKMGFAEVDVRRALHDCRGDEILAIEKLRLGQQVQKLVKMGFAEIDVRSALQDCRGDEILAIEKLRLGQQRDEQKVQKLVKMGFAEVDVRRALQDSRGDEILAIIELRLGQRVQKLVKMGFAEVDVRIALEYSRGDEILAIKMLRLAECAWGGNVTNTKLWQHGEQQVQKLVEMGFAEAVVESALEAVNGDEILAIKMLCFAEFGPAGIDTYRKLWQPDEQQVQKLVEIGFAEAAVRSALEAVNGDEILAIKTLFFADCGPARIGAYRMQWQPDEQQVQKLVEMGFAEAAVRSALEAVKWDEILAIKMIRFADCGPARIEAYRKLWQPDEPQVQKLVEMCCDDDAAGRSAVEALVRSALEAVNGDEILAITMLRFVAYAQALNDKKTKV